jgi:hypothetical protein
MLSAVCAGCGLKSSAAQSMADMITHAPAPLVSLSLRENQACGCASHVPVGRAIPVCN